MKTWLETQREHQAEMAREREARQAAKTDKSEVRATPIKERVRRIIRDMPPHERHKPQHISYFVSQLAPRWNGDRASPRDVARGLRENGWVRKRDWKGERDGFTTFWIPPPESN